jgi:hypothetical protein
VAQDVSAECKNECPWADFYVVGEISDRLVQQIGPYDVISLTHVIEHLTDPVEVLQVLSTLITGTGCIFITAPHRPKNWNRESPISQWSSWSYNHVPGHLQYFSESAMKSAALRSKLVLAEWSMHEDGQAFEAILRPAVASGDQKA